MNNSRPTPTGMGDTDRLRISRANLAQTTLRGFGWTVAGSLTSKSINFAGQLALAWLLVPDDFGLIGLAYTVGAFVNIVGQLGIRVVLVQRHAQFRRWATAAMWMSLAIGLTQAIAMVAAAPIAVSLYDEPRVASLVFALAIAAPFKAVAAIPTAKLQIDLRFQTLAAIGAGTTAATMALTILFAAMGFGALSFAIPAPIIAAISLAVVWSISRPSIRWHLNFRRWKFLIGDNLRLLCANFLLTFTAQGDYIILGALHPASVVGRYYFAFRLSMQSMTLITGNLSAVLFPALSRISEPRQQTNAYLRGARLLAAIGIPLAGLQAALADPVMRLLFDSRWIEAIPLVQVLSLGMTFRIVGSPAGSLVQAQGRFGYMCVLYAAYAGTFVALVTAAATIGEALAVAVASGIYFGVVVGLLHPWLITRRYGGTIGKILRLYATPVTAGAIAIGGAMALGMFVPVVFKYELARIAVTIGVGIPAYFVLLHLIDRALFNDLRARLVALVRSQPSSLT